MGKKFESEEESTVSSLKEESTISTAEEESTVYSLKEESTISTKKITSSTKKSKMREERNTWIHSLPNRHHAIIEHNFLQFPKHCVGNNSTIRPQGSVCSRGNHP